MKFSWLLGKRSISSLSVIGSGQMGTGIALVAANVANIPVTIVDNSENQLKSSDLFIEKWCNSQMKKDKINNEQKTKIKSLITHTSSIELISNSDFVIEAASENFEVKKNIFKKIENLTNEKTILATNTSSISITKLAGCLSKERASSVIGMHFMNPVPLMKLIEIISGLQTNEETLEKTKELALKMNKTCTYSRDIPGFIANRILMPYINEAVFTLYEGIGSKEDIDKTMKLGTNVPMGPLTLADFIGLDTCLAIMNVLHSELGDSKYRPCPLLVNYVNAGYLGKKTKQGFYTY